MNNFPKEHVYLQDPYSDSPCAYHDWETAGVWGVVMGVSRCRKCGELATENNLMGLRPEGESRE